MKTRALLFPEANRYETAELSLADLGPDDIRVTTTVTAVSPGTERWLLRGLHLGAAFPCVPGYHRIGIVEECGRQVTLLQPGDVVYGTANRWQESQVQSMWGAHIGHSVGPAAGYRFLASTPPGPAETESLAFAILAGVANRGVRFCEVKTAQKVLIIGGGILGLCAAQLAALRGAEPMLLERDSERRKLARRVVPAVAGPEQEDLGSILNAFAPAGFDVLYDTVGHAPTTDAMVKHTRRQGTLLLQAQYFDKERCALDLDQIKIRELTVRTTCGTDDRDFAETVTNIRARRLNIASLITHRFDARDIRKGYDLLDAGTPLNLGIVFRWTDSSQGGTRHDQARTHSV